MSKWLLIYEDGQEDVIVRRSTVTKIERGPQEWLTIFTDDDCKYEVATPLSPSQYIQQKTIEL